MGNPLVEGGEAFLQIFMLLYLHIHSPPFSSSTKQYSLQNPNAPSGVSSQLWKCVAQVPEGDEKTWWKTDYDDSAWQSAGEIEIHGGEEDQPTKGME